MSRSQKAFCVWYTLIALLTLWRWLHLSLCVSTWWDLRTYRHTKQRLEGLGYTYSHGDLATYRHTEQRVEGLGYTYRVMGYLQSEGLGYTYSHGTFIPTDQRHERLGYTHRQSWGPRYLQGKDMKGWCTHTDSHGDLVIYRAKTRRAGVHTHTVMGTSVPTEQTHDGLGYTYRHSWGPRYLQSRHEGLVYTHNYWDLGTYRAKTWRAGVHIQTLMGTSVPTGQRHEGLVYTHRQSWGPCYLQSKDMKGWCTQSWGPWYL